MFFNCGTMGLRDASFDLVLFTTICFSLTVGLRDCGTLSLTWFYLQTFMFFNCETMGLRDASFDLVLFKTICFSLTVGLRDRGTLSLTCLLTKPLCSLTVGLRDCGTLSLTWFYLQAFMFFNCGTTALWDAYFDLVLLTSLYVL